MRSAYASKVAPSLLASITEIEERSDRTLVEVLREGRVRHAESLKALGADQPIPSERSDRLGVLASYRRVVATELLGPLMRGLDGVGPAVRIPQRLDQGLAEAVRSAGKLPESVDEPWPEGVLKPQPSDGTRRRLGKFLARGLSAARRTGKPRAVPLRDLALRHLAEDVVPGLDTRSLEVLRLWAEWERTLEATWLTWSESALPALAVATFSDSDDHSTSDGVSASDRVVEAWAAVAAAGLELDRSLGTLIDDTPLTSVSASLRQSVEPAEQRWIESSGLAGSFLGPPTGPSQRAIALRRLASAAPRFTRWEAAVLARLQLCDSVLNVQAGVAAVTGRLLERGHKLFEPRRQILVAAAQTLEELASGCSRERCGDEAGLSALRADVDAALGTAREALEKARSERSSFEGAADSTVDAVFNLIRQVPSTLALLAPGARPPSGSRRTEVRTLALQEGARQAFDALRIEQLRTSGLAILDDLDAASSSVGGLDEVADFAFGAAHTELEKGQDDADVQAAGLAREALESMSASLRAVEQSLGAGIDRTRLALNDELFEGIGSLLDHVVAGRVQARLLAARSRIVQLRLWYAERWAPVVETTVRGWSARVRGLRLWIGRLVRRGSELVVGARVEGASSARVIRSLLDAERTLQDLPLVYQRLFTLDPIADPALLAGRGESLSEANEAWERWRTGEGMPLVIQGARGVGVTSFLRAFSTGIEAAGGRVSHCRLGQRVPDEASLSAHCAEVLGVPGCVSLDALARTIFHAEEDTLPDVVFVDDLEHAYLRVAGGSDLVERFLTLMAETEPRVLWVAGITSAAWQVVSMLEPTAVSQVETLTLEALPAGALRQAITNRHRRSGLPVRFEEPKAGRRMLRRRLRRISDPGAYQETLAQDFFDHLHRGATGSIRLALLQWLQAARFEAGSGVTIGPFERADFSVLNALGQTQNFTLKAFLEHGTLTLEEHDRIFRLPRQESYQIFESLRNRHLIELIAADGDDPTSKSEIQEHHRYTVRALVAGAVSHHLRSRNILH